MDYIKRDALLNKIGGPNQFGGLSSYVSLEDFIEGNDDPGSLWPNLYEPPKSPFEAFRFLEKIREHPEVDDLFIWISDFDEGDGSWPFAERVVVVTQVDPETVFSWFERYPPDSWFGEEEDLLVAALKQKGVKAVALWWD